MSYFGYVLNKKTKKEGLKKQEKKKMNAFFYVCKTLCCKQLHCLLSEKPLRNPPWLQDTTGTLYDGPSHSM